MILVQVNISYQFKGFAIQYRINCPFVTAILTKQGKKKTYVKTKISKQKWMKKAQYLKQPWILFYIIYE